MIELVSIDRSAFESFFLRGFEHVLLQLDQDAEIFTLEESQCRLCLAFIFVLRAPSCARSRAGSQFRSNAHGRPQLRKKLQLVPIVHGRFGMAVS